MPHRSIPVLVLSLSLSLARALSSISLLTHVHSSNFFALFDLVNALSSFDSSVLEQNLKGHVKRCPMLKQVQSLSLQPFYQKGINAGSDGEQEEETLGVDDSRLSTVTVSSEMKRNVLHRMSVPEFCNLIEKIESFHESLCKDIQDSFQMPEVCSLWIKSGVEER